MISSVSNSSDRGVDAFDTFVQAYADFESKSRELGPEIHRLWTDAISFHTQSMEAARTSNKDEQERFLRAAVLVASAAFEGFTNFLAQSVVSAGAKMSEFEKNILQEKQERINDRGNVEEPKAKVGALPRFLLLYRICSNGLSFEEESYQKLKSAFQLRDEIVHPKPGCDLSLSTGNRGTKAFLDFMTADMMLTMVAKDNPVSRKVFSKIGNAVQH
jgi:hypothetical protein